MAININYDKCYDGSQYNIGKTNIINKITIDIKSLEKETDSKNVTTERSAEPKTFEHTYFDNTSALWGLYLRQRSIYTTSVRINLPYSQYDGLKDAMDIQLSKENTKLSGTKYEENDGYDPPQYDANTPLFSDSEISTWKSTKIVYENPTDGQISYKNAQKEYIDTFKFRDPRFMDKIGQEHHTAFPYIWRTKFEKKDTYATIIISFYSKISLLDYGNLTRRKRAYIYDNAQIVLEYTSPSIKESTATTLSFGNESASNSFDPKSQLFVNGNTLFENDLSKYYADEVLANYNNGKTVLSLKLPLDGYAIPDFATSSWKEIVEAGRAGLADKYFKIGDARTEVAANGKIVTYRIIDFYHDDRSDGSGKAPITLETKDIIFEDAMEDSGLITDGWSTCSMRAKLASDGADYIPEELKDYVLEVNKVFYNTNRADNQIIKDKFWIPSAQEVFGDYGVEFLPYDIKEGYQYQFYKDVINDVQYGAVTLKSFQELKRNENNDISNWWTRTNHSVAEYQYGALLYTSEINGYDIGGSTAGAKQGVSMCFCI